MDLYLYAQPNQNYLVDLVVVISNGQRRFQITQQEFGLPGQQPPPVTKDQDVGIPNAPSFSHVTTYIAAPNGGSSAYWLQLHYTLEPFIHQSGATPGTWSFMEADVSYY